MEAARAFGVIAAIAFIFFGALFIEDVDDKKKQRLYWFLVIFFACLFGLPGLMMLLSSIWAG